MHYAAVIELHINKSKKFLKIKNKTSQADKASHYQPLVAGNLT